MFRSRIILAARLPIVAAAVLLFWTGAHAAPEAKEVRVVNTPDVNVANTPDVNVANTPNVNVANTPNVNVANTVPVTEAFPRTPFQYALDIVLPPGDMNLGPQIFSVGPGERAVIESVSFLASMPSGQLPALEIHTWVGGVQQRNYISHTGRGMPILFEGQPWLDIFRHMESLRLYAEEPRVIAHAFRDDGTGEAHFKVTVSGYFVSIDSPSLSP